MSSKRKVATGRGKAKDQQKMPEKSVEYKEEEIIPAENMANGNTVNQESMPSNSLPKEAPASDEELEDDETPNSEEALLAYNAEDIVSEGMPVSESSDESESEETLAKARKKPVAKKAKTALVPVNATYILPPVTTTHKIMMDAISSNADKNGISIDGIKKYVEEHYPEKDWTKFKVHLKKALIKGLSDGVIVRPKNSEVVPGLTGRFKLNKVYQGAKAGEEKPKKTSTEDAKVKAKEKPKLTRKASADPSSKTVSTKSAVGATKTSAKARKNDDEIVAKKAASTSKKTDTAKKAAASKQASKSPKDLSKSRKAPSKLPKAPPKSPRTNVKTDRALKSPKTS